MHTNNPILLGIRLKSHSQRDPYIRTHYPLCHFCHPERGLQTLLLKFKNDFCLVSLNIVCMFTYGVYMCLSVCMYVCMDPGMYVYMLVSVYVCMYVCACMCVYV